MNSPIRLADVARAAGVSLGTASNVFNRPDAVRAELREQVLEVARTMGYAGPDPKGRLLMGGKAHAIGLLPPGDVPVTHAIGSPYLRAIALGIAEICDENGANLLILSGSLQSKAWAIHNALVDGFVLGQPDEIPMVRARPSNVPMVMLDMDAGGDIGSVRIDARGGARQAAEHLLALGHRRFAIASVLRRSVDPVWHPPGRGRVMRAANPIDLEKLEGYAEALAAAGLSIDDMPIVEAHPPLAWAESGARMLLDRAAGATAVLAMSDRHAMTVLAEAARRGIRVPEQLSVIGFDDVEGAATAVPPLTTIAQPIIDKGRIAARMLFSGQLEHQRLPVRLVMRGSTGPAPG
jgi:DNA-binding LacI/PurR family transcriptional regulator